MPRFDAIPKFTPNASWHCDIGWAYLEEWLQMQVEQGFTMDPDFQRGHVWTERQQIRYVEYILRGGTGARDIMCNHPGWQSASAAPYELVDGKQRLTAVLAFLRGQIRVFGHCFSEYEDRQHLRFYAGLKWHVNELKTRREVLQWYLDLNAGGVVHTTKEIERVRELLAKEGEG
jgi:hypothetical protein